MSDDSVLVEEAIALANTELPNGSGSSRQATVPEKKAYAEKADRLVRLLGTLVEGDSRELIMLCLTKIMRIEEMLERMVGEDGEVRITNVISGGSSAAMKPPSSDFDVKVAQARSARALCTHTFAHTHTHRWGRAAHSLNAVLCAGIYHFAPPGGQSGTRANVSPLPAAARRYTATVLKYFKTKPPPIMDEMPGPKEFLNWVITKKLMPKEDIDNLRAACLVGGYKQSSGHLLKKDVGEVLHAWARAHDRHFRGKAKQIVAAYVGAAPEDEKRDAKAWMRLKDIFRITRCAVLARESAAHRNRRRVFVYARRCCAGLDERHRSLPRSPRSRGAMRMHPPWMRTKQSSKSTVKRNGWRRRRTMIWPCW